MVALPQGFLIARIISLALENGWSTPSAAQPHAFAEVLACCNAPRWFRGTGVKVFRGKGYFVTLLWIATDKVRNL